MPRACGECDLCCTIMGVPALDKPAGTRCELSCGKCSGYEHRPQECRDYSCWWLIEGAQERQYLREDERPDKSGVVVSLQAPGSSFRERTGMDLLVLKGDTDSWAAKKMVKRLERKHLLLMVRRDGEFEFAGPEQALLAIGVSK